MILMDLSVRSKAPVRISFAGGGTDVFPYSEEKGGCVISTSINKYSFTSLNINDSNSIKLGSNTHKDIILDLVEEVVLDGKFDLAKCVIAEMKPEKGMNLFFRNDVVPRSGLGSSAAAFVSLLGAFTKAYNKNWSKEEIAKMAFDFERNKLKINGGKQDQYASAIGGLNFIEFKENSVKVNPLNLTSGTMNELEKNIVLVFTQKRESQGNDILSDQINSVENKNKDVVSALDVAKQITINMKSALKNSDLEQFGRLLHEGWIEKKKYSKMVSNPFIDKLYEKAISVGAIGGKISGAGGGGHMIFYCYPDKEVKVQQKLESLGAKVIPFSFEFKGLQTWRV